MGLPRLFPACLLLWMTVSLPAAEQPPSLSRAATAYEKQRDKLPPDQQAGQWLAIAQRYAGGEELPFDSLVGILPGPETWDTLASRMKDWKPEAPGDRTSSIRHAGLQFLGGLLENNEARQWAALHDLQKQIAAPRTADTSKHPAASPGLLEMIFLMAGGHRGGNEGSSRPQSMFTLGEAMLQGSDSPERVSEGLLFLGDISKTSRSSKLELPDLVGIMGDEKARALIKELLQTSDFLLEIQDRGQTATLTQEVALESAATMKRPQWGLVKGLKIDALFEAMEKRFGATYSLDAAQYYWCSLIAQGKTKEAAQFRATTKQDLLKNSADMLEALSRTGYRNEVFQFLNQSLAEGNETNLGVWELYMALGVQTGHPDEPLQRIEQLWKDPKTPAPLKGVLALVRFRALLAVDQTATAKTFYAEAWQAIAAAPPQSDGLKAPFLSTALQASFLLKDESWLVDVISAIQAGGTPDTGLSGKLADVFESRGQIEKAAALYLPLIEPPDSDYALYNKSTSALVDLLCLYVRAGEYDKARKLLDTSPCWPVPDIRGLLDRTDRHETPAGWAAAQTLHKTGGDKQALPILEAMILQGTSYDPVYELYLILENPVNAAGILDRAAGLHRFEERPLIWKAELLRREKKLDEALTVVKAAVAIDPSDGEIGKDRRMQVYAVWGAIATDQGDTKTADQMKSILQAIRLAEHADDFYQAGLLTQGLAMYEKALGYFSDAYCIQSRMALQLMEAGRSDEAAVHYQKAFELMPDSFGRMESHCFGCEGAFRGTQAEDIAEKVFTRLVKEKPDKPQLHYLLGYLREEQGRLNEAAQHYRRAVELDPDYINAWKHLQQLLPSVSLPSDFRDRIITTIHRLCPDGNPVRADLDQISNLRTLWNLSAGPQPPRYEPPSVLYPLPGAAAAQAVRTSSTGKRSRIVSSYMDASMNQSGDPRQMIGQQHILEALTSTMSESDGNP
jgi:tetratricopeptide (TPR) repeat protein